MSLQSPSLLEGLSQIAEAHRTGSLRTVFSRVAETEAHRPCNLVKTQNLFPLLFLPCSLTRA